MGKKGFSICYSNNEDTSVTLQDISAQMENQSPSLVIFFSDSSKFSIYSLELHKMYPNAEIIGATTYISFSSKGYSSYALTVLAVFEGIECAGGVIVDVKRYPQKHIHVIQESLKKLSDFENCCCLELTTAFDSCEEIVQDTFRKALEPLGIPVAGGSAGNERHSTESYVSYNGKIYPEACCFVIVKNLNGKIHIFKENMYHPTEKFFYATDVDCEERKVYEFDGRPAAKVLAKALNVKEAELPGLLSAHPLGRMINDEIYIAEHDAVTADGALTYFTRIYNHTKMVLLEADDPQKVLTETINDIHKSVKKNSFMMVVNCISRSRLFEKQGNFGLFADRLKNELGEYVGFSGYGEQMNYEHLNQTMLVIVFE